MFGSSRVHLWIAVLGVGLFSLPAVARQGGDDDEPYLPGLAATYRDAQGLTAVRLDHRLTFHWGETPPDERLGASDFRALWQGYLFASPRGDYRFHIFGSGEIELKIGGKIAVARQTVRNDWLSSLAVPLTSDYHSLELSFRRTDKDARLMLLWSGPDFVLEPIPPHSLYHPRDKPIEGDFERGQLLARVLRCSRCHGEEKISGPGPSLDRLAGHLSRAWLIHWLTTDEHAANVRSPRRMPSFDLSPAQASAIADWLLTPRVSESPVSTPPSENTPRKKALKPDAKTGERLFVSLGCLACHRWRDLGGGGWFGGGDLTHIGDKRPADFFAVWLAEPACLNHDHRMPIFQLANEERASLALFLAQQVTSDKRPKDAARSLQTSEGRKLVEQLRCAACHRLSESLPIPSISRLDKNSNWDRSCMNTVDAKGHRPGYRLSREDTRAVRRYYAATRSDRSVGPASRADARQLLLAESNCFACHAREGTRETNPLLPPLLTDKLDAVGKRYPHLAALIPALTPPALDSVGDKLTDSTLVEAIGRRGEVHRPYLHVRMPRFSLSDDALQGVVRHLIDTDRVPSGGGKNEPSTLHSSLTTQKYVLAGGRLVSSDGFGCTSCHAFGRMQPASDSLNARGPDLKQLDRRIRRAWFDRWVRNPARIVPRMEMPSVQIPVAGVLDGKLDEQLDAVWHVLNLPSFQPPLPNPIRTLRHTGSYPDAEPIILTDLLQHGERTRVEPFLFGLANRHNVLFDLQIGGMSQWTVGDVARQHARGKAWFWDQAGTLVLDTALTEPDLSLVVEGRDIAATPLGQFVTEADVWQTENNSVVLQYRLAFPRSAPRPLSDIVRVRRKLTPSPKGFTQEIAVADVPVGAVIRLHLLSANAIRTSRATDGRTLRSNGAFSSRIAVTTPAEAKFSEDARTLLVSPDDKGRVRIVLQYEAEIPLDRFPEASPSRNVARKVEAVEVAPGFVGQRLPLPSDIMPTGLSWRPNGRLIFCTLKGQLFEVRDTDSDGVEDRLNLLADGLPAPFGVCADEEYVDISAKNALLRLSIDESGHRMETLASGWGYSADYHDWAVGLPRNERGEYFLGIPCQQDQRSPAAARFHGNVLRLTPREPTHADPHRFALTPISAGHRFPMGLALDRSGELFVTDNQGNYKPFNELNHVRAGVHFGFINTLDRGKPMPPRTPTAIDIPHPWTRSTNGICFLNTPKELRSKLGRDVFGPLEGHLIGCEYDTRRLIRMSLQRVGDTFQGAAYPLSIPPSDPQRGFLGPLVCAVSRRGELYVGSIRDSGWGAGTNIGEIVRVQIHADKLPCGLAEIRATPDGFTLDFFRPIDRTLAGRIENYTIQSYRREPTPAYGAPDRDRRTEKVISATVSADARRATLKLATMRPGFVYELRLKNLAPDGGDFHPAEAHYTLIVVPR